MGDMAQEWIRPTRREVQPDNTTRLELGRASEVARTSDRDVPPESVAALMPSPGRPLASPMRAAMEAKFGHDFSQVQVHTDADMAGTALDPSILSRLGPALGMPPPPVRIHADGEADTLARSVGARAFTVGTNLFFARGEYRPGTEEGDRLLTHELAHVVQQRNAVPTGDLQVSSPHDSLEVEAEAVAQHTLVQQRNAARLREQRWGPGVSQATTSLVVHRQAGRFTPEQVEPVRKAYEENEKAAREGLHQGVIDIDRAACIVMLNVALAKLFPELHTRRVLAHSEDKDRPASTRKVWMAALSAEDVQLAMEELKQFKLADKYFSITYSVNPQPNGKDALEMQDSAEEKILKRVGADAGWYFFGMSILDGVHSVLVAVENTGTEKRIHWLDQFSQSIDEVEAHFDSRLTERTETFHNKNPRRRGFPTSTKIWPIHGRLPATRRR